MKCLALVANKTEDMELITPIDIWRREGIKVDLVSVETKEITLTTGTKLIADKILDQINFHDYDILFLPGGSGCVTVNKANNIDKILKHFIQNEKYIFAICAAPFILGSRGYLDGKKASCHESVNNKMGEAIISKDPSSVFGKIVTSRNNLTAQNFALTTIELMFGLKKRNLLEAKYE